MVLGSLFSIQAAEGLVSTLALRMPEEEINALIYTDRDGSRVVTGAFMVLPTGVTNPLGYSTEFLMTQRTLRAVRTDWGFLWRGSR